MTHILILYLLILPLVVETNQRTLQDYSSYIILKTNGTGNISIFSNLYSGEYPNEIQVMRENTWISVTNDVQRGYYFDNSQNNINSFRLSWNNEITSISYIFKNCKNIIEISLTNFNSSKVTRMREMFYRCESLSSLDLSNFNTSRVIDMEGMFSGCSSLKSLDLSNFNTSLITSLWYTFLDCTSLNSLKLFNFDTPRINDMYYTFYNCKNLKTLDLSKFDTSKVTTMFILSGIAHL